jgi:hypothetical protein
MLKKFMLSLFFIFAVNCSCHAEDRTYDQAVSLGFSCQVVWQLETNGKRSLAYPFDWVHTHSVSLLSFLANKGAGFLELKNISIQGKYAGDTAHMKVVDIINGIISYHDIISSPLFGNYKAVKAKYDRRIKRFFELLNSNKKVLFVRQGDTKAEIEHLDYFLHESYPNLNYDILAVNCTEEYHTDWEMTRVKNYFIPQIEGDWMGNFECWKEVLSHFSVIPGDADRPLSEVW